MFILTSPEKSNHPSSRATTWRNSNTVSPKNLISWVLDPTSRGDSVLSARFIVATGVVPSISISGTLFGFVG